MSSELTVKQELFVVSVNFAYPAEPSHSVNSLIFYTESGMIHLLHK